MDNTYIYNQTPINYRISGSGPLVVLIHGFPESLEIWADLSSYLDGDFTVLAPDLPGHGRSGMLPEPHTMESFADTIEALIRQMGYREAVLIGHSMGGYISLTFAEKYPEMVKGIVLYHSNGAPDNEEAKLNRERTINIVKLNPSGFIHDFVPKLFAEANQERLAEVIQAQVNRALATPSRSIIASLQAMKDRKGSLEFLMDTHVPLYFVIGKEDSRMPYNKVIAQAMMCKNAEVMILGDVGHMGFLEDPVKINPALRDFVRRCYL